MFCWKIKTGIVNGASIDRISSYVTHFYDSDLKPHFEKEEDHLFILLPPDDTNRILAKKHHDMLSAYISKLNAGQDDALSTITEFNKLLEEHIRFEERELFPLIEQQTDPVLLAKASERINAYTSKITITWDDIFWTKN